AETWSAIVSRSHLQETRIGPCGVGTVPLAHSRSPGCGSTVKVVKPGEVGSTPRTYSVRAGAAPLDQPGSHDGTAGLRGRVTRAPIVSHIVDFVPCVSM